MAEVNLPEPKTRLEQYWAGILDKIEGGGGNPNYIETIEGTLANPWGDKDISEIRASLLRNEISVYLRIGNWPVLAVQAYNGYASGALYATAAYADILPLAEYSYGCYIVYFNSSGEVSGAFENYGDNTFNSVSTVPTTTTTLTIIHPPLPDSGT